MDLLQNVILLMLSISLVQSRSIKALVNETSEETANSIDEDYFSVSAIIERANKNAGKSNGEITIIDGDIAVYTGLQNADPCTSSKCKWPRSRDGKVRVPMIISRKYSRYEKQVIQAGLNSFQKSTCIQFIPRTNQKDYIEIISGKGFVKSPYTDDYFPQRCYSFVGRIGGKQVVSLQRGGCVDHSTVQHELLHALGFHHEHQRSDRDKHVKILFQNVEKGEKGNFVKVNTNNLKTPYDYNSVMHYGRFFFSKNGKPTIVPKPNPKVSIGRAKKMSPNDILRIKRLYCN